MKPKVSNFIKKEALAQVFSYKLCEISKNIFSCRTLMVAASAEYKIHYHKNEKITLDQTVLVREKDLWKENMKIIS